MYTSQFSLLKLLSGFIQGSFELPRFGPGEIRWSSYQSSLPIPAENLSEIFYDNYYITICILLLHYRICDIPSVAHA